MRVVSKTPMALPTSIEKKCASKGTQPDNAISCQATNGICSGKKNLPRWFVGIATWTAPAIAQRPSEFHDSTDEYVAIGQGSMVIAAICFFALLWLYSAKSGLLHDWAEEHPGLATTLLLTTPIVLGYVLG